MPTKAVISVIFTALLCLPSLTGGTAFLEQQVIISQIDARLWTYYHTTLWLHHLTRTIMY